MPSSDAPKTPSPGCYQSMQFILLSFHSSSFYQWEQGHDYIYTTSFAISDGESLSSRWRTCLWQCLVALPANRGNSASAGSWSPVSQLSTRQSLLQTIRSSLLAPLVINGNSMAQFSCLIVYIWCHLRLWRISLLWLSTAASGQCHEPCL